VGVDRQVIFWDLRQGMQPVLKLKDVHKSDINTIDWCSKNDNLIATGSNDTLVKILDVRKAYSLLDDLQSINPIINTLHKHQSKVHVVKFAPFSSKYLASSGDSLIFWDL
jgi:WD40 repeat protein